MNGDYPSVHNENELKTYGRTIARQVRQAISEHHTNIEREPKPDLRAFKSLSIADRKSLPLRGLGISKRVANALEEDKRNILFVGQLLCISYKEVLLIPNQGPKAIRELARALDSIGLLDLWDFDIE